MKPIWQSKTLWINLAMAVGAFFGADQWIGMNAEFIIIAVNVILRVVSKDQLTLA